MMKIAAWRQDEVLGSGPGSVSNSVTQGMSPCFCKSQFPPWYKWPKLCDQSPSSYDSSVTGVQYGLGNFWVLGGFPTWAKLKTERGRQEDTLWGTGTLPSLISDTAVTQASTICPTLERPGPTPNAQLAPLGRPCRQTGPTRRLYQLPRWHDLPPAPEPPPERW
jgi:hypothetical protein